jgi:alpha-beta hydrolase superfamily lysophospholipase
MPGALQGILQPQGFPSLPPDWVDDWENYPSVDGNAQIFSTFFRKKSPAPGQGHRALIVSHGIGEHGGRYLHFPHYLQKSVDWVVCPDHRGHGRSEGLRGHVNRFTDYEDDLELAVRRLDETLQKRYGKSEIHVFGHSMGALISMGMLYRYPALPIQSATASSLPIALRMGVPLIKKMGASAMSRLWGSIQMSTGLDVSALSHDREVARTYSKDRLVHSKITPRLFIEMQNSMAALAHPEKKLAYPLQLIVPMDDPIVDPEAALSFYQRLEIRDKQLKTYPGFLHESFNELSKEKAFEDLQSWIMQHKTS